jgi:phosphate transport system substrate-binding protein
VKINRLAGLAGAALVAAMVLAACGSNSNGTGASSSPSATSGIKCASGTLTGAGSTAQANAMSVWVKNYQTACSAATVNYGGGGSGAGVTSFQEGTVDFAGSDFPLNATNSPAADKRCGTGNTAIDLPMVPGAISVSFNLPGITSLQLSADTIAQIFSGKITKWNDPAIAANNPGVSLPSTGIQTFHRSDGSGTSYNFTNYLKNDAPADWPYGANKVWPAPGGQGVKGSSGVAQGVKTTVGGIGYFEVSFATQNGLNYAKLGNAQGTFVALTSANVVTFLSKATVTGTGGDLALTFDYANTDPNAYPNVLVTYEIVCQSGNKSSILPLLKGFLGYTSSSQGQGALPAAGYVELPASLQTQVNSAVNGLS